MLEDGAAARVIETQRDELRKRHAILRDVLASFDIQSFRRRAALLAASARTLAGRRFRPHLPSARRRRSSADAFAVGREFWRMRCASI